MFDIRAYLGDKDLNKHVNVTHLIDKVSFESIHMETCVSVFFLIIIIITTFNFDFDLFNFSNLLHVLPYNLLSFSF